VGDGKDDYFFPADLVNDPVGEPSEKAAAHLSFCGHARDRAVEPRKPFDRLQRARQCGKEVVTEPRPPLLIPLGCLLGLVLCLGEEAHSHAGSLLGKD
jgi:hypothetical protein